MVETQMLNILGIVIAAICIAAVMGFIGMLFWYVRVKPDIAEIKSSLSKKAAADEVDRVRADLERKKEEANRIMLEINRKQDMSDCELLRKGCQPLFLERFKGVEDKVDELKEQQQHLTNRLEKWMQKNGIK